jgi:hypothetical protein
MSFLVARNGQQLGPFSEIELQNMLAAGQVALTDLVWLQGDTQWRPLNTVASFTPSTPPAENGLTTMIPVTNPAALVAYYLGVFSLIPCLGLLLAIPALILGIIGLRKVRQNPQLKGTAHAWIGIVLGALMTLLWGGLGIAMVVVPMLHNYHAASPALR